METEHIALSCDDDYFITLLSVDDGTLLPDDKYAEELQMQETIVSSFTALQRSQNPCNNNDEVSSAAIEIGESSEMGSRKSSPFSCEICAEMKDKDQIFPSLVHTCNHLFCIECVSKHISIRLNQDKNASVPCPGLDCRGVLEIDNYIEVVPREVAVAWGEVACESKIRASQRFYCPYKSCSGLMVNDGGDRKSMREAECTFFRRLFCARCNAPWHSGVDCDAFSKLSEGERGRDDLMVHELAKKKKWQRCPRCRFFVEKKNGCLHITCRFVI